MPPSGVKQCPPGISVTSSKPSFARHLSSDAKVRATTTGLLPPLLPLLLPSAAAAAEAPAAACFSCRTPMYSGFLPHGSRPAT